MAQFDYYLNRQGTRGPQGEQGEQGFSPIITVATDTLSEYILQIQTQNNTFQTANLREHKDDLGGTYIRYNRETGVMYAGDADIASQSQMGVVRFAATADIEREASDCVVSPADVQDMISASSDITDLQGRVTTLEGNVSDNSLAISELQSNMSGLLANYVPKTRTINGHALSSNVTITASDVDAYSKSEADALLLNKANVSDLPDMNNYYNTTQIDLMLNEKADISDIPTVPTNVSAFTNDAGYITSSALPAVGNGVITFTQGGVTKGTITANQSGNSTIALDAAGSSLTEGTGIDITNDVISVDFTDVATASQGTKADTAVQPSDLATVATTGDYADLLNKPSIPDVSNLVTTNTAQTITGTKKFNNITAGSIYTNYITTANGLEVDTPNSGSYQVLYIDTDIMTQAVNYVGVGTNSAKLRLCSAGSNVEVQRREGTFTNVDSGNISSYLPDMNDYYTSAQTDSLLAGKANVSDLRTVGDGTITFTQGGVTKGTITTNQSGDTTIAFDAGGGSSYTAGTGIDITSDVISIDDTVVATKDDLDGKQDSFGVTAPIVLANPSVGNAYSQVGGSSTYVLKTNDAIEDLENIILCSSDSTGTDFPWDGTGQLVLDFEFKLKSDLTSSLYNNPISIYYTKNGTSYATYVHFDGYDMKFKGNPVTLAPGIDYQIRLILDIDNNNTILYYKQKSDSTYSTLGSGTLDSFSGNLTYARINNTLYGSTPYTPIFEADMSGVKLTANNTVIFEGTDTQVLSLNIGSGLSVDGNGNLVNTNPNAPTVMTGATSSTAGTSGLVPAPAAGDDTKFLSGDGTFKTVSASAPSNMVTTDTTQTISGTKTFYDASVSNILSLTRDTGVVLRLGNQIVLDNQTRYKYITAPMIDSTAGRATYGDVLCVKTSGDGIMSFSTELSVGNTTYASLILKSLSDISIIRGTNTYTNLDSGNIGTYALTSSTGVSSTNIRTITKLTQSEYDALATKDANTFYVIVAASSSS